MHEPERVEQLEYVVSQMHPDDQLELHRRICRIATALYRENPNFGKQPQFKIPVEPYGITANLTAQWEETAV